MKTNIDTIHEIIESSFEYVGPAGGFDIAVGNIIATINPDESVDEAVARTLQYLNAELDKKDAEIQRLTANDDAVDRVVQCQELLARYIVPDSGISDHAVINDLIGVLDAPLVVGYKAHDDAIRRECADRAWEWFCGKSKEDNFPAKKELLTAAILATEPAREKDGCFRCRNRPLPGASGELCKSCKLVIGKNYDPIPILGTDPAREES